MSKDPKTQSDLSLVSKLVKEFVFDVMEKVVSVCGKEEREEMMNKVAKQF